PNESGIQLTSSSGTSFFDPAVPGLIIDDDGTLSFRTTNLTPFSGSGGRIAHGSAAVPEPLTILGSVASLGFGVAFRKLKRKQD
ncbi:MAG: PEP-CTERM sorting domain-containing protein, partial [Cyanobacteria bacterium J06641_5]